MHVVWMEDDGLGVCEGGAWEWRGERHCVSVVGRKIVCGGKNGKHSRWVGKMTMEMGGFSLSGSGAFAILLGGLETERKSSATKREG